MSTSIQLYTLLEKTSSFFSFFKFATESKKYLGERFDAYAITGKKWKEIPYAYKRESDNRPVQGVNDKNSISK
ncbi:MAG: hypothetical protein LIP15_16125 [Clostridium sp.]|nr:hypothetical protein [Clostridium sp.]